MKNEQNTLYTILILIIFTFYLQWLNKYYFQGNKALILINFHHPT